MIQTVEAVRGAVCMSEVYMTIEEAEKFYKKYLGHGFHMGREEGSNYHSLQQLNLPDEYYIRWDQELLDSEIEKMWTVPGKAWSHHQNILDILYRGRLDIENGISRLLDEMKKMQDLGILSRTMIIENMAGRNSNLSNGGVYLICRKTKLEKRMKEVMAGLIREEDYKDRRFSEAVKRYENALKRYGRREK